MAVAVRAAARAAVAAQEAVAQAAEATVVEVTVTAALGAAVTAAAVRAEATAAVVVAAACPPALPVERWAVGVMATVATDSAMQVPAAMVGMVAAAWAVGALVAAARAAVGLAVAVQVVVVKEAEVQVAAEMATAAMVTATVEEAAPAGHPLAALVETWERILTEPQIRGMVGRAGRHLQAARTARRCCRERGSCDRPHHCPRRPASPPSLRCRQARQATAIRIVGTPRDGTCHHLHCWLWPASCRPHQQFHC